MIKKQADVQRAERKMLMRSIAVEIADIIVLLREELKVSELESVMRGDNWRKLMSLVSDNINMKAKTAGSESEIAFEMDRMLINISEGILIPCEYNGYDTKREKVITLRNVNGEEVSFQNIREKKRRIDSKYNNVIIEYKKPEKYKTDADVDKARNQAIEYLVALNEEEEGEYFAIITDGLRCQFVECNKGEAHIEPTRGLSGDSMDRIIRAIIKLSVKELTSANLIHDLVDEQRDGINVINSITKVLYSSLKNMNDATTIAYEAWMDNFGLSHDDASQQQAIEDRRRDLAAIIDRKEIQADEEYKILFALQTATAIIAMLIAYKAVSVIKGDKNTYSLGRLLNKEPRMLRIDLLHMGSGVTSSKLNIYNLLEIGCFSWAFDEEQWSEEIGNSINTIVDILLKYENMPELTDNTDDIFRDLYMAIIPTSVRHSLGEYYTAKWLAQHVIESGMKYLPHEKKEHVRVLDTAAGSGTFPQNVISAKREQYKDEAPEKILGYILNEVASIDANILAVILARVNYFISISDLIAKNQKVYIPVYIGDSTVSNSEKMSEDGKYYIDLISDARGNKIEIRVPVDALVERENFIDVFKELEDIEKSDKRERISKSISKICKNEEDIDYITDMWVELQQKGMISPAVVSSIMEYFLLCSLGKFDMIVGNPPWVDWKSLPSVHREKIKNACVSRELFSGDGRTGGINLNVCALLSNISAENWLAEDGVMAILMPQNILFQQSYEGYRKFKIAGGKNLYFQEIIDWEKAGHPFYPVQQLFATYILSATEQNYFVGIPAKCVSLKRGNKLERIASKINKDTFGEYFDVEEKCLGRTTETRTAFTYAKDKEELAQFQIISGETDYIGREGVEYYPQELQLFHIMDVNESEGTVSLRTYQNARSKYSIDVQEPEIETTYLRPLVKGVNVSQFHVDESEYVVAFPYKKEQPKIPIAREELRELSPELYKYYKANREHLEMQTGYSDSIIGNKDAEYYALARTGAYSHAPWYVAFRDNTKWVAAVVGKIDTEWGGQKAPAFQNHCVSICEKGEGKYITENEAHYICAIMNSHIVEDFILSTSDKRTFKIRLPIKIVPFDNKNTVHKKLASLSKKAHSVFDNKAKVEAIRNQIDVLYLETLKDNEGDE